MELLGARQPSTSFAWRTSTPQTGRRRPRPTAASSCGLVIVTDPGPDPDDVKALLIAAVLHRQGDLTLHAVVANGGWQALNRARLARCVLDHAGARDVPVGVGSQGSRDYSPQPHEYRLAGFDEVRDDLLEDGAALLLRVVHGAARKSLTVVCISSLRDLAELIDAEAELVLAKVREISVMGGLERDDSSPSGWVPDTSVNNTFDMDAARAVYDFCFARDLPLTVVSRHAVPMLPMQLARSFAVRTGGDCPVMSYLADAQFLGLEGLWQKMCEGKLPPRCTKQWYFETFCGVDAERFGASGFDAFGADADIKAHLNGFVKPYDVVALMAVLPHTRACFLRDESSSFRTGSQGGASHSLFLDGAHQIDVRHVLQLLRDTYHEVVLASAAELVSMTATAAPSPRGGADDSQRGGGGAHPASSFSRAAMDPARGVGPAASAAPAQALPAGATQGSARAPTGPPTAPSPAGSERAAACAAPARGGAEPQPQRGAELASVQQGVHGGARVARDSEPGRAPGRAARDTSSGTWASQMQTPAMSHRSGRSSVTRSSVSSASTGSASASFSWHPMGWAGCAQGPAGVGAGGAGGGAGGTPQPACPRLRGQVGSQPIATRQQLPLALPVIAGSARASKADGGAARLSSAKSSAKSTPPRRSDSGAGAGARGASRASRASRARSGSGLGMPLGAPQRVDDLLDVAALEREPGEPLSESALAHVLEEALSEARSALRLLSGVAAGVGMALLCVALALYSAHLHRSGGGSPAAIESDERALIMVDVSGALGTSGFALLLLAISPSRSFLNIARFATATFLVLNGVTMLLHALDLARYWLASGAISPALVAWIAVRAAAQLAIGHAAWAHWRRCAPLVRRLRHATALMFVALAVLSISNRAALGWLRSDAAVAVSVAALVYRLGVALLMLWPSARRGAFAALARCLESRTAGRLGAAAPLAPLIGFGTRHERAAAEVLASARRAFAPVPLDDEAIEQLVSAPADALGDRKSSAASSARGSFSAGRRGLRAGPPSSVAPLALALALRRGDSRGTTDSTGGESGGRPSLEDAELGGGSARVAAAAAQPLPVADYYIVHSADDDADAKRAALGAWARAKAAETGVRPTVWFAALHGRSPTRSREALHHLPVCLGRSRRLLLLSGPSVTDQLWCIAELYAWRLLGGSDAEVESLCVATSADARERTLASFDAFAVMYAHRAPSAEDRARIVRAVELASVRRVNEAVRSYLQVARRAQDRQALQRAAGLESDEPPADDAPAGTPPPPPRAPRAPQAGGSTPAAGVVDAGGSAPDELC